MNNLIQIYWHFNLQLGWLEKMLNVILLRIQIHLSLNLNLPLGVWKKFLYKIFQMLYLEISLFFVLFLIID